MRAAAPRSTDPSLRAATPPPDDEVEVDETAGVAWGTDDPGPAPDITLPSDLPANPPADDADPTTADLAEATGDPFADLVNLVGVRLASAGRIYYCDAHDLALVRGDRVVVEGERDTRLATVAIDAVRKPMRDRVSRRVLRRANDADLRTEADHATSSASLLQTAKARARATNPAIKVFRIERSALDGRSDSLRSGPARGGRVVVYYTCEERVELRELVRELGVATGARVELRQIGVRDEAKLVGGIGSCGLELCCTTWLPDFVPVSIKMAKDQGMVLTPTKVSGQCGRLKCCLVYEQAGYAELRKGLPKLGKRVITARGEGRVVEVDVLRQRVRVAYGPGESEFLPGTEVRPMFPSGGGRGPAEAEPETETDLEVDVTDAAMPSDDPAPSGDAPDGLE
jgi:cell fate regulator YaaT (PSP1 superfamily)